MIVFSIACSNSVDIGNELDGGIAETDGTDTPSAALLLNGPISDMGWNASAYSALEMIKEKYGAEISFAESVSQSDMEEVYRSYATAGFDIIYGHGSQFTDACLIVAREFPETQFIIINGSAAVEPNVACMQIADDHQGFLMGAIAGLMTKTGTVGVMGGLEIPPITNAVKGFKAGVKYVNPEVEVLSTMTGSFDDAAKAKETTLAFIDAGADYVGAIAGAAGMGSIEGCQDCGIYAIGGAGGDQSSAAPDTVLVSVIKDVPVPFIFAYEKYMDGTLEQKNYRVGVKEHAVYYSSFHEFEDFVPQEVKDELEKVITALGNDEIDYGDISY
ncbi:BMP family protein [Clostridia bacterium]|nr:BMP family protein [Clostridia bacterium]